LSNARILVTGGSGFIGSGLVKALLRAGCAVRVLDDNSRGSPRRLADVARDIEFIAGDIRDAQAVENAAHGMTRCIISLSSTARNFSTTRPIWCSMSACAA
jgi:nucleoside-diphosphate-sugar epimerase